MVDDFSNGDYTEQLITAIEGGEQNYSQVQELLGRGDIDVNAQNKYGVTALSRACLSGHVKMVKLLIDHGAIVYSDPLLSLIASCWRDPHLEIVQMLIQHGSDVNAQDEDEAETPLHLACFRAACLRSCLRLIVLLIDSGAYVDAQDVDGCTPLHCVCGVGGRRSYETAKVLLEYGANVNSSDHKGHTPLDEARGRVGNSKTIDLLIANGAV